MSRVGRNPIVLPAGVNLKVEEGVVRVEKGNVSLFHRLPPGISVSVESGTATLKRERDDRRQRAMHGLTRALLANAVRGVSEGFSRGLEIVGIGLKAQVQDRTLQLALGYSHPIYFPIPEGIEIRVDKQVRLIVSGADKQRVGQVASEIRGLRPPEPYKGKGIRYSGEFVKRKAGKAGKTGGA